MPQYYEDKPKGGACAGVKEDLGACLLQSDCVLKVARPDTQCDETPWGDDDMRTGEAGPGRRLRLSLRWLSGDVDQGFNLGNLGKSAGGVSAVLNWTQFKLC